MLAEFSKDELDMLRLFWEHAFNESEMYLSSSIIKDKLRYKRVSTFYIEVLREKYMKGADNREIPENDELVKMYLKYQHRFHCIGKGKHAGGRKRKTDTDIL